MAGAVDHLGGIGSGGRAATGWSSRVQQSVRVGAHNDVDPVAGIGGDHLVHIVAAVGDHNDDVGALGLEQLSLLPDGVALVAEDQLAGVGQILEGN